MKEFQAKCLQNNLKNGQKFKIKFQL